MLLRSLARRHGAAAAPQLLRAAGAADHTSLAAAAAVSALLGSAALCDEEPDFQTRMIGRYENKIRSFSPPERVFEYFASVSNDKGSFMTPEDFVRSITPYEHRAGAEVGSRNANFNHRVPYPSAEALARYRAAVQDVMADGVADEGEVKMLQALYREVGMTSQAHRDVLSELGVTHAQLEAVLSADKAGDDGAPSIFTLIDTDGDGLISYAEYMFFTTLLSIPVSQFKLAFEMFDDDGNGTIQEGEFRQLMDSMRKSTPAGQAEGGTDLLGRDRHNHSSASMYELFFGADGSKSLSFEEFAGFVRRLQKEVQHLEFTRYDTDHSGELSVREFAMFLVAHVEDDPQWVARADSCAGMAGSIPEADFLAFYDFLTYLDEMKVAMQILGGGSGRGLSKAQFLEAAAAATGGRQYLTELQVDVLFAVFDADGDGTLDIDEFVGVMAERETRGMTRQRNINVMGRVSEAVQCFRKLL